MEGIYFAEIKINCFIILFRMYVVRNNFGILGSMQIKQRSILRCVIYIMAMIV